MNGAQSQGKYLYQHLLPLSLLHSRCGVVSTISVRIVIIINYRDRYREEYVQEAAASATTEADTLMDSDWRRGNLTN